MAQGSLLARRDLHRRQSRFTPSSVDNNPPATTAPSRPTPDPIFPFPIFSPPAPQSTTLTPVRSTTTPLIPISIPTLSSPSSTTPLATPTLQPSTTSTSTTSTQPTTSTTPTLVPTTSHAPSNTVVILQTATDFTSVTHAASSAAATTSHAAADSVAAKGTTSTGTIAGMIAAGVLALLGVAVALAYLLRRCRRIGDTDADAFDASARRQSRFPDPASFEGSPSELAGPAILRDSASGASGRPRPPTMIERRLAQTPVAGAGVGVYGFSGYGTNGVYNSSPYPASSNGFDAYGPGAFAPAQPAFPVSFVPGNVLPSPVSSPPPTGPSPNSAQPLMAPYGGPHPARLATPQLPPQPQAQEMAEEQQQGLGAGLTRNGSLNIPAEPSPGNPHYVDLARSSVSPFQAAQYAEISRRLGEVAPIAEEEADKDLPAPPAPAAAHEDSPFADPASAPASEAHHSAEDDATDENGQELELPSAPYTRAPHARITSTPPVLPEIALGRASAHEAGPDGVLLSPASPYDFPVSAGAGPSPFAAAFAESPRAPAFVSAPAPAATAAAKRPDTVYDPEDAYGGI